MEKWINKKSINFEKIKKLLKDCEINNQFSNYGPNVRKLEFIIKDKLKIDDNKAIIVVSNGSSALHVLSSGIELHQKTKIKWATQSYTFPSSVQCNLNDTEIVDIDSDGGLDLKKINNNINGLIVTNVFGSVVDIKKYEDFVKENNKILIFDNAATPFTFYKNKSCCNYGTGCTISFHHTKSLGFGEGGAIIVDKKYEQDIRSLINFGFNNDNSELFYHRLGNNFKMSEISAVYIIQYLDNFDFIVDHHKSLYNHFIKEIKKLDLPIKLYPSFHDDDKILLACFCIIFQNVEVTYKVQDLLINNNIFSKKYYNPLKKTDIATNIFNKNLCIPCNLDVTTKDIDNFLNIIKNIYIL